MSDCKPTPSNTMCHLLCLQQQPSYIDILMYKQRDCSSDPRAMQRDGKPDLQRYP